MKQIDIKYIANSNKKYTKCYAFGFANLDYDLDEQTNVDAFREFVTTNYGTVRYTGIVQLRSNVTGLDYHSGQGDEEFIGVLPKVFNNVNLASTDQTIIERDNYENYIFCGIQDGINETLWNFSRVSVSAQYFMLLTTSTVTNGAGMMIFDVRGYTPPNIPGYITTTSGTNISWETDNDILMNNVAMSSTSSRVHALGPTQGDYLGTNTTDPNVMEFIIFKVSSESTITGFLMYCWTDGNGFAGQNVEIRTMSSKSKFPEFDEAIKRTYNTFAVNAGDSFLDVDAMTRTKIFNMFDRELASATGITRIGYDFISGTLTT